MILLIYFDIIFSIFFFCFCKNEFVKNIPNFLLIIFAILLSNILAAKATILESKNNLTNQLLSLTTPIYIQNNYNSSILIISNLSNNSQPTINNNTTNSFVLNNNSTNNSIIPMRLVLTITHILLVSLGCLLIKLVQYSIKNIYYFLKFYK